MNNITKIIIYLKLIYKDYSVYFIVYKLFPNIVTNWHNRWLYITLYMLKRREKALIQLQTTLLNI